MKRPRDIYGEPMPWRQREEYRGPNLTIDAVGLTQSLRLLTALGWVAETVENLWTNTRRIYLRHPKFKLVGRADLPWNVEEGMLITLDFLTHESNVRIRGKQRVYIEQDETPDTSAIDATLDRIIEMQRKDPRCKPPLPQAEIFDMDECLRLIA